MRSLGTRKLSPSFTDDQRISLRGERSNLLNFGDGHPAFLATNAPRNDRASLSVTEGIRQDGSFP